MYCNSYKCTRFSIYTYLYLHTDTDQRVGIDEKYMSGWCALKFQSCDTVEQCVNLEFS